MFASEAKGNLKDQASLKRSSNDTVGSGIHDSTDEQIRQHREHHEGAAQSKHISTSIRMVVVWYWCFVCSSGGIQPSAAR